MTADANLDYRPATAVTCIECGERRRAWGRLCGPCYREINGIGFEPARVVIEAPVVVVPPPPKVAKEPKPRVRRANDKDRERTAKRRAVLGCARDADVDALWAARPKFARVQPVRTYVARFCEWPGCGRKHDAHGYCRRDLRRFRRMGIEPGAEDAAGKWAAYLLDLGDKHAEAGALRGKVNADNPGRVAALAILSDGHAHHTAELVAASGFDPSSIWRVLRAAGATMVQRGVWRLVQPAAKARP